MVLQIIVDVSHVEVEKRFLEELHAQKIPLSISLDGNAMHVAIAKELLKAVSPHRKVTADGTPVQLCSMEEFGAMFVATFLEKKEMLGEIFLLHTIPEADLIAFAKENRILIVKEPAVEDSVKEMLDEIAKTQPQTYSSLARSAQRLLPATKTLRDSKRK